MHKANPMKLVPLIRICPKGKFRQQHHHHHHQQQQQQQQRQLLSQREQQQMSERDRERERDMLSRIRLKKRIEKRMYNL